MTGAALGLPIIALAAVVGLMIGSFLNVVIWRVPRGESVVSPPSACPRCGHAIRRRDNVPVVSWLALGRRCRDCRAPISARYPLVEVLTSVVFALLAWMFGWAWVLPAFLYLGAISVALTLIDLDTKRLPNAIVLPAYPTAVVLLALGSWNPGGASDWWSLCRALIGGAVLYSVYFVVKFIYPPGMGFGDVKLAGVVGLFLGWVGWGALAVGWFAAFALGGMFSIGLLVSGRARRTTGIPFGPWIVAGALVGVFVGQAIGDWYVGML